jgi:hypothetical protein
VLGQLPTEAPDQPPLLFAACLLAHTHLDRLGAAPGGDEWPGAKTAMRLRRSTIQSPGDHPCYDALGSRQFTAKFTNDAILMSDFSQDIERQCQGNLLKITQAATRRRAAETALHLS